MKAVLLARVVQARDCFVCHDDQNYMCLIIELVEILYQDKIRTELKLIQCHYEKINFQHREIEMNQKWMRSSRESAAAVPRRDSGKWEEHNSFPIKGFHHLLLAFLTNDKRCVSLFPVYPPFILKHHNI